MKTKIKIKSIYGNVLFEFEKENNTIKDTVEEAVKQDVNLSGAILTGANLQGANLYEVNLREANLNRAILHNVNLCRANLYRANLSEAYLQSSCLSSANLGYADLWRANLRNADLSEANLYETNLYDADLRWANLRGTTFRNTYCDYTAFFKSHLEGAKNVPYIPFNCPSEGAFIAWKKVKDKLVKLEIPEDAKRSSATTMKCRCNKAKVLSITDLDGSNPINEILNTSQKHRVLYEVGEMVYPDSFDENRWDECSHGIHFFINKQDAINY